MKSTYKHRYTDEKIYINTVVEGSSLKIIPEREGIIQFDQVKHVSLDPVKSINDLVNEELGSLLDGFDFVSTEDEMIDVERKVLKEMGRTPISFLDGRYEKDFLPALILCLDLRGFSNYTRDCPKQNVKDFLEKYTQELLASINMYNVSYYKLLGDGALVIWDRPEKSDFNNCVMLFKLLRLVMRDIRTKFGFQHNIAGGLTFDEVYKYEIGAECSGLKYRDYIGYGINYVSRLQGLAVSGELLTNKNLLKEFPAEAKRIPDERMPEKNSMKGIKDADHEDIFVLVDAL